MLPIVTVDSEQQAIDSRTGGYPEVDTGSTSRSKTGRTGPAAPERNEAYHYRQPQDHLSDRIRQRGRRTRPADALDRGVQSRPRRRRRGLRRGGPGLRSHHGRAPPTRRGGP